MYDLNISNNSSALKSKSQNLLEKKINIIFSKIHYMFFIKKDIMLHSVFVDV